MQKIKIIIEYNGSFFHGSAKNNNVLTIQGIIEESLCLLFKKKN